MNGQEHQTPRTEWLTLAEAARRLHTTERTVSRLVKTGRLRGVHLSAHEGWRVRASDVDALGSVQEKAQG